MNHHTRQPVLLLSLLIAAALPQLAAAQTWTYNGPFTGTALGLNPWSTDSWLGPTATPLSSTTTQLILPNFNTNIYATYNDLGSTFLVNSIVSQSWSQIAYTISNVAGNSLQLAGANPFVNLAGPGSFNLVAATTGGGLILNPSAGTTTFAGAGAGTLTVANAGISGTGGIAINFTGAGGVSLTGTNTFTGGVTLNAGSLNILTSSALGAASNVLTVNGGSVRATGSQAISNALVLNNDLVFTAGTLLALNGTVSGAGGVQIVNGTNFSAQNLTFNNTLSFAGPLTIQNSVPMASAATTNFAIVTLNAAATLGSAQTLTVGNNGTLNFAGNAAHTANANNVVLNGGRLGFTGVAGGNLAETFGNVAVSGLGTFTINTGATNNTLTFGNLTRQDNATLFFRGPFNGVSNVLTFANGLATTSDPLAPNTGGLYTAIVPFATGNNFPGYVNAATRVTYSPATGIGYISPLDGTRVYQAASGETLTAANVDYKNVNFTGSALVNDARRINSLSMTGVSSVTGSGTLLVSSGAVMPVAGSSGYSVFNGPTLDFGAATGYVHLGSNLAIQGASSITGSGGLVISGLDAQGSGNTNGANAGYSVHFSNAANTFTGGLYLNGNATLNFTSDAQLGAAGGAINFNGGGLNFNPAPSASVTINRSINLGPAGGAVWGLTGNSINLTGSIGGTGPLTIGGTAFSNTGATVTLSGNNSFSGPIYIVGSSSVTLRAGSDANLGNTSTVNFQGSGGTLQFTASNTVSKSISFSGGGGNSLDTNDNNVTLSGQFSGVVTGGFNKVGAGTLTLSASSPLFAGRVAVNAGTLNLAAANTLPQVTTLTVNAGGTLAGTGGVGGSVVVASGGTLAPGNSAGQITIGNSLTEAAGGVFAMELGGAGNSSQSDQLLVGGSLTLAGNLTLSLINGYTPAPGDKFFLFTLTGTGTTTGTFANGSGAGGMLFSDNLGNAYQVNYNDRNPLDSSSLLNNDISLTAIAAVPEPSSWMLFAFGLCGFGLVAARRQASRV